MSKIIAVYLGPEGLGLIGQLSSFVSIALVLAGGSINNGIVKYVAEFNTNDPDKIPSLLSTAFKIICFCSLGAGIILMSLGDFLARLLLFNPAHKDVFIIFGASVFFYGLNNLLLSIMNGLKEFKKYNLANIASSVLGLATAFVLISIWNIKGALIALVINQSVAFLFLIFYLRKEKWLKKENFLAAFDYSHLKSLMGFMTMALVTTACVPFVQLFLRRHIAENLSLAHAGWWEAINRISSLYLMFITMSLSTYYLPRLSELKNSHALKLEIFKIFRLVMPLVILASALMYFLRTFIIKILFTDAFAEVENLFLFQLIGDVLKIASWLLAYQMVAKAMIRMFILTEVAFSLSFLLLSVLLLQNYSLEGVTYAYAFNYFGYLCVMVFIFRKLLFGRGSYEKP